jgi:ribosome maturation factor RimP
VQLAHEQLKGLDRDRVLAATEPVLRAHGVDAVELIWRSDHRGWVLYLTLERPGSTEPGSGITLDLCAEISRDLSTALDVAAVIGGRYRLEVGSPGVERALYRPDEYARFAGHAAKLRLREARDGQRVIRGVLKGKDDEGRVILDLDGTSVAISPDQIEHGQLVFDWQRGSARSPAPRPQGRGRARTSHRNR